jgi:hypothetical protein
MTNTVVVQIYAEEEVSTTAGFETARQRVLLYSGPARLSPPNNRNWERSARREAYTVGSIHLTSVGADLTKAAIAVITHPRTGVQPEASVRNVVVTDDKTYRLEIGTREVTRHG